MINIYLQGLFIRFILFLYYLFNIILANIVGRELFVFGHVILNTPIKKYKKYEKNSIHFLFNCSIMDQYT